MAGVKHQAFYSCTRIDPHEIYRFIRRHYPEVTWLFPKMTFWDGIRKNSPPLRRLRWCCDVLKKNPSKHIPMKHRVMGIRKEESRSRAEKPRVDVLRGKQVQYKPIFDWKEWHVWEFIDHFSLPYPSIYDEGFERIGCVICPFIMHRNHAKLIRHQKRWPAMYKVFESVITDWFLHHNKKKHLYSEKTPEEYLAAYYSGFEHPKSHHAPQIKIVK